MLGQEAIIYYASKMLNDAQMNYMTTKMELFAVVSTLDKFFSYIHSSHIVVFYSLLNVEVHGFKKRCQTALDPVNAALEI